jgi:cyanophycin synthetase
VAQDIGLPVDIKPTDNNNGIGVSLGLKTEEGVKAAYHIADAAGSEVLVERYILGDEHRLLVVGNHLVAATKGETVSVIGDGVHTVSELIELQINSDPGAVEKTTFPWTSFVCMKTPKICCKSRAKASNLRRSLRKHEKSSSSATAI